MKARLKHKTCEFYESFFFKESLSGCFMYVPLKKKVYMGSLRMHSNIYCRMNVGGRIGDKRSYRSWFQSSFPQIMKFQNFGGRLVYLCHIMNKET